MNYTEWALQRGLELWHEREETLKKRLSLVPESTARKTAADMRPAEEKAAAQKIKMSGGTENAENAGTDPAAAAVRLGRKLGLGATQEDGKTGEETVFFAGSASAAERAALSREKNTENADNASGWMQKILSTDGRDGASAAVTREKSEFLLAQEKETRETESFSLSLERDARRYDGGFLFY